MGACLAFALLSNGCSSDSDPPHYPNDNGGAPTTSPPPAKYQPPPQPVLGTWAFAAGQEDATVIALEADHNWGCSDGWVPESSTSDYARNECGPVKVTLDGWHIAFELVTKHRGTPCHFLLDGIVSRDGARIGGTFRFFSEDEAPYFRLTEPGSAVAYVRDPSSFIFPTGELGSSSYVGEGVAFATATTQGPYLAGQHYTATSDSITNRVTGDFGEYLGTEISVEHPSDEVTIVHAGPVQATRNDRPVSLSILYVRGVASEADVGMPNGERYSLAALAR